jgi:hypothetical protein
VQKHIESVGRSPDFRADVVEGLARFSQQAVKDSDYLPANIILASFDTPESDLQDYKQELLAEELGDSIRFLQTPVVRTLNDKQYLAMICDAAGKAAATAEGIEGIKNANSLQQSADNFGFAAVDPSKLEAMGGNELLDSPTNAGESVLEDDVKFVEPLTAVPDVAPSSPAVMQGESSLNTEPQIATSFGVPIKTDLTELTATRAAATDKDLDLTAEASIKGSLGFGARFVQAWKKPYQGKRGKLFFVISGLIAGIIVVAIGLVGYTYASVSSIVTISFEKKPISKEARIIVDAQAEATNPETQTLAATTIDKTVTEKGTIPTTGVKIVGDKASGSVTIFNKTVSTKKFDSGTVFKVGDLGYTLDGDVSVASASVQEKQGGAETKYGQAQGKIIASDIGADYNKDKDTRLTIGSFASETYDAVVESDGLKGGASREVRVVAQEDADAILAELRDTLISKANAELVEDIQEGNYLIPTQNVISQTPTYSFKVGDESDQLDLELSLTVKALTYTVEDLRPLVQAILGGEVPEGFELNEEEPQILTDNTAESSDSASTKRTLTTQVSSFAVPKIDLESIKNQIGGQSVSAAQSTLKNSPSVSSVEIKFIPEWISSIRKKLPQANKIEIRTTVK